MSEDEFNILDFFNDSELKEKSDGNFITPCPSCGADSDGYGGLTIFPKTQTAFCHNSGRWFTAEEVIALKEGMITCIEGREPKK